MSNTMSEEINPPKEDGVSMKTSSDMITSSTTNLSTTQTITIQSDNSTILPTEQYSSACEWAEQQYKSPNHPISKITLGQKEISPRAKLTTQEIQTVQNLIERCIQIYMNQSEVVTALQLQAQVDPDFTTLVWQKLEENNKDFFKAYNIRLRIKEQITAFNYLVSQQAMLMQRSGLLPSRPINPFSRPSIFSGAPVATTQMKPPTLSAPAITVTKSDNNNNNNIGLQASAQQKSAVKGSAKPKSKTSAKPSPKQVKVGAKKTQEPLSTSPGSSSKPIHLDFQPVATPTPISIQPASFQFQSTTTVIRPLQPLSFPANNPMDVNTPPSSMLSPTVNNNEQNKRSPSRSPSGSDLDPTLFLA